MNPLSSIGGLQALQHPSIPLRTGRVALPKLISNKGIPRRYTWCPLRADTIDDHDRRDEFCGQEGPPRQLVVCSPKVAGPRGP